MAHAAAGARVKALALDAFRRHRASEPERWDWAAAHVPEALTEEGEAEKEEREQAVEDLSEKAQNALRAGFSDVATDIHRVESSLRASIASTRSESALARGSASSRASRVSRSSVAGASKSDGAAPARVAALRGRSAACSAALLARASAMHAVRRAIAFCCSKVLLRSNGRALCNNSNAARFRRNNARA